MEYQTGAHLVPEIYSFQEPVCQKTNKCQNIKMMQKVELEKMQVWTM